MYAGSRTHSSLVATTGAPNAPWRGLDHESRSARMDVLPATSVSVPSLTVVNDLAREVRATMPNITWCILGSHAVQAHLLETAWPRSLSRLTPGIVVVANCLPGGSLRCGEDLLGVSGQRVLMVSNAGGSPCTHDVTWISKRATGPFQRIYETMLNSAKMNSHGGVALFPIPPVEQLLAFLLSVPKRARSPKDITDVRLLWHYCRPSHLLFKEALGLIHQSSGDLSAAMDELGRIVPGRL